jgi:hypothetical protein
MTLQRTIPRRIFLVAALATLALAGCKEPDPRLHNVNYRSDLSTLEIIGAEEVHSDFNRRGFQGANKSFILRFSGETPDEGSFRMFVSGAPTREGTWKKEGDRYEITIDDGGKFDGGHAVFEGDNIVATLKMPMMKMGSTEFESREVKMTYKPEPLN